MPDALDTPLTRARAAVDTSHLERSLDAIAARRNATRDLQRDPTEYTHRVAADVIAGHAVPDDLGARLAEIRRTNAEVGGEFEALRSIEDQVRNALQLRRRTGADRAVTVLTGELAEVTAEARAVFTALGDGVTNPAEAIAEDRVQEWRRAVELAGRHDAIRAAQRVLSTNALAPNAHLPDHVDDRVHLLVDILGHVRQPQRWTDVALHIGVGEAVLGGGRDPRLEPGLVAGTKHMHPQLAERSTMAPWLVDDPVARLRFVCRSDVEPWIPTPGELREARGQVEPWRPSDDEEPADPAAAAEYRRNAHSMARAHQVSG